MHLLAHVERLLVLLDHFWCIVSAHRPDDYADKRHVVTQSIKGGVRIRNGSDKNKSCLASHSWPCSEQ